MHHASYYVRDLDLASIATKVLSKASEEKLLF
jgi:hypothetical protein